MTTLRLDLAYDGSGFRGYAFQEGLRTVQGDLEAALKTVLGHPMETAVAGNVPYQVAANGRATPTDANTIQTTRGGVAAALVSIPAGLIPARHIARLPVLEALREE